VDAAELSTSLTPVAGATGRRLAVERLRQAILAGDMAPGQRLVEEELAGTLGVTRASLRAALFDLAAEGLVERIPNRGARVRAVTLDEAIAITECRMALEGLCAAKAAERVTESDAARLRQIGEEMERSVADGELLKYSALNHELHRLVREISGQAVATSLLERLNGQLVRHQFQLSLRPGRPQASLPEHLAIIAAVAAAARPRRRRPSAAIWAASSPRWWTSTRQPPRSQPPRRKPGEPAGIHARGQRARGRFRLAGRRCHCPGHVARRSGHGAVPELRRARRVG
jgi:DNA-binding GntR family transcriptional regulator